MAYERLTDNKIKGEGLDVFVENAMKLYNQQLTLRNSEDENNFNRLIIDQSLSLGDQLDYRKEQLKRIQDDPTEKKRIQSEITTLKARVAQQQFSEAYTSKVADVNSGVSNLDSVINWLQNQSNTATDPDVKLAIGNALAQKQQEKFSLIQQLVTAQTNYAINDKTESIINTQLSRVTTEKNKALLAGNDNLAATYDLQLQSLNKALNENDINKDIKNFAVATITGYASATALLDSFNQKISSSAPTGPVKIDNVTYASPQEYWKFKRDSYLADTSTSGFFSRFNDEQNTALKVKDSQNILSLNDVQSAASQYDQLLSRPELANYQVKINSNKQDSIQTATNLLSSDVVNRFAIDYSLPTATSDLNNLKNLGGNVNDAFGKIINTATQVKSSQINSLVNAAQGFMQNDPNLSPTDAVNLAISKGYGAVLSPSQVVSNEPSKVATETVTAAGAPGEATKGTFGQPDQRLTTPATNFPQTGTTPPPVVTSTPAPTPNPAPTANPSQQNQTSAVPASPTPAPTLALNKQLDLGTTDPQVKALQKFLNSQGFTVAASGEGSAGNETNYFGPLTQAALQKFQAAKGIVSTGIPTDTGYGRLGPQTLSAIQKILG